MSDGTQGPTVRRLPANVDELANELLSPAIAFVERDGATDDAVAQSVVRHRLAGPQRVAGGVLEGGRPSACRSTGMVELTRAVVRGAFTGDLCGDFTGAHRSTDCEPKWITCNSGRGGCNYV